MKNIYIYIYPSEKIGQIGGASRWRVCYQRGLPRLVLIQIWPGNSLDFPFSVTIFVCVV